MHRRGNLGAPLRTRISASNGTAAEGRVAEQPTLVRNTSADVLEETRTTDLRTGVVGFTEALAAVRRSVVRPSVAASPGLIEEKVQQFTDVFIKLHQRHVEIAARLDAVSVGARAQIENDMRSVRADLEALLGASANARLEDALYEQSPPWVELSEEGKSHRVAVDPHFRLKSRLATSEGLEQHKAYWRRYAASLAPRADVVDFTATFRVLAWLRDELLHIRPTRIAHDSAACAALAQDIRTHLDIEAMRAKSSSEQYGDVLRALMFCAERLLDTVPDERLAEALQSMRSMEQRVEREAPEVFLPWAMSFVVNHLNQLRLDDANAQIAREVQSIQDRLARDHAAEQARTPEDAHLYDLRARHRAAEQGASLQDELRAYKCKRTDGAPYVIKILLRLAQRSEPIERVDVPFYFAGDWDRLKTLQGMLRQLVARRYSVSAVESLAIKMQRWGATHPLVQKHLAEIGKHDAQGIALLRATCDVLLTIIRPNVRERAIHYESDVLAQDTLPRTHAWFKGILQTAPNHGIRGRDLYSPYGALHVLYAGLVSLLRSDTCLTVETLPETLRLDAEALAECQAKFQALCGLERVAEQHALADILEALSTCVHNALLSRRVNEVACQRLGLSQPEDKAQMTELVRVLGCVADHNFAVHGTRYAALVRQNSAIHNLAKALGKGPEAIAVFAQEAHVSRERLDQFYQAAQKLAALATALGLLRQQIALGVPGTDEALWSQTRWTEAEIREAIARYGLLNLLSDSQVSVNDVVTTVARLAPEILASKNMTLAGEDAQRLDRQIKRAARNEAYAAALDDVLVSCVNFATGVTSDAVVRKRAHTLALLPEALKSVVQQLRSLVEADESVALRATLVLPTIMPTEHISAHDTHSGIAGPDLPKKPRSGLVQG